MKLEPNNLGFYQITDMDGHAVGVKVEDGRVRIVRSLQYMDVPYWPLFMVLWKNWTLGGFLRSLK